MAAVFLILGAVGAVVGAWLWLAPGAGLFVAGVLCIAIGVDLARPPRFLPPPDEGTPS